MIAFKLMVLPFPGGYPTDISLVYSAVRGETRRRVNEIDAYTEEDQSPLPRDLEVFVYLF